MAGTGRSIPKIRLEAYGLYTAQEIEQFALAYFDPKGTQAAMSAAIKPASDRFKHRYKEVLVAIAHAKEDLENAEESGDTTLIHNTQGMLKEVKEKKAALDLFKKDLGTFVRMYEFLSQIVDYEDSNLEKLSVFARGLLPNLKTVDTEPPIDISSVEMTHYSLRNKTRHRIDLKGGYLDTIDPGSGLCGSPKWTGSVRSSSGSTICLPVRSPMKTYSAMHGGFWIRPLPMRRSKSR